MGFSAQTPIGSMAIARLTSAASVTRARPIRTQGVQRNATPTSQIRKRRLLGSATSQNSLDKDRVNSIAGNI